MLTGDLREIVQRASRVFSGHLFAVKGMAVDALESKKPQAIAKLGLQLVRYQADAENHLRIDLNHAMYAITAKAYRDFEAVYGADEHFTGDQLIPNYDRLPDAILATLTSKMKFVTSEAFERFKIALRSRESTVSFSLKIRDQIERQISPDIYAERALNAWAMDIYFRQLAILCHAKEIGGISIAHHGKEYILESSPQRFEASLDKLKRLRVIHPASSLSVIFKSK